MLKTPLTMNQEFFESSERYTLGELVLVHIDKAQWYFTVVKIAKTLLRAYPDCPHDTLKITYGLKQYRLASEVWES